MIGLRFYPLVSAGGLRDEPKERLRGEAKTVVDSFVSSGVSWCEYCSMWPLSFQYFVLLVSHAR